MNTLTIKRERKIQALHAAFHILEGDGFGGAIPSPAFEAIGPFVLLDHFGPIEVRPGDAKGALAHPHAGIETLNLLLERRTLHNDSLGNVSAMGSGEVQWMRAGRAVIHDEAPDEFLHRSSLRMHGVQLWINMPKGSQHTDPDYTDVKAGEIPLVPHETGTVRLVAGRVGNLTGPVRTSGDPFVVHASLRSGGTLRMDATKPDELAVCVMTGNVAIHGLGRRAEPTCLSHIRRHPPHPGEGEQRVAAGRRRPARRSDCASRSLRHEHHRRSPTAVRDHHAPGQI
jgi:quercetin 2,3-dioxygenase